MIDQVYKSILYVKLLYCAVSAYRKEASKSQLNTVGLGLTEHKALDMQIQQLTIIVDSNALFRLSTCSYHKKASMTLLKMN